MGRTQVRTAQIDDGGVQRADLCTTIAGAAVITKVIAGTGIVISYTGVDSGTGDVTAYLASGVVTPGTYPKVTVDTYGRVTGGTSLIAADLPSGSGYYIANQLTQQSGNFNITGSGHLGQGLILESYTPATTTNTLYQSSGTLSWNGQTVVTAVITSIANSDTLIWDSANGYWKNSALPTATASTLGAVKVGNTLSIASGVLDINSTIAIPIAFTAGTTTTGEVKNISNENYRVLLHFDGINTSRRFLDSGAYANLVAPWGSNYYTFATHSTAQSKFGGSSLLLNGSTWLEVFSRFSIGTSDFTVDFHAYFTSVSGTQTLFDWGGTASGIVMSYSSGTLTVTVAGTACTFSVTPTVNTWYHIAVSRTSGSVRLFVSGTKTGTTQTASGSVTATGTASLLIGANASLANLASCYIDEFRFLTGLSAYTTDSNISVPTAQYTPHGFRLSKSANLALQSGSVMTVDSNGLALPQRPPVYRTTTFVLGETTTNSSKYFYVARGLGNTQDDSQRSGNASGMSYQCACSPEIAPCNGRVVRAILKVQGTGTNNGTVTYPVVYRCDLYRVGWSAEHDPNINGGSPATINFSLSSGVGTYSAGTTNATSIAYNLDIPINIGDALALKFIATSSASTVAISQMAMVTLVIEETF